MSEVYFTIADPFDQRLGRIGYEDFVSILNANLILHDSVIIAESHVLESDLTSYLLLFNERGRSFIEEGFVKICIPRECTTCYDYIEKFIDFKKDKRFYNKLGIHMTEREYYNHSIHIYDRPSLVYPTEFRDNPEAILKIRAKILDEAVPSFISYEIPEAREIVFESLRNDLDYKNSPYRTRIKSIEECNILKKVVEWVLKEHGTLNRPLLIKFIESKQLSDGNLYSQLINLAYYLGGLGIFPDAKLHSRKLYLDLINRKLLYDKLKYKQVGVNFLAKSAFKAFLRIHGLGFKDLSILDVDSLKDIRKTKTITKFRKAIFKLVHELAQGNKLDEDKLVSTTKDIEVLDLEVKQIVKMKIEEELRRLKIPRKIRKISRETRIAGTTIAGIGSLYGLLSIDFISGIITTSTGALLLASGPIAELIIRKRSNFIAFGELLKKKVQPIL